MNDLISRDALRQAMYHEAFEKDSDEQRWDGGCWIRYKMFERVIESMPSAQSERDAIQIDWIKDWFAHKLDFKDFEEFLEPPYDLSVYVQSILEQMFKDWSEEDE